jgi:hypothetical protein
MTPAVFETKLLQTHGHFQGWRAWNLPLLDVTSLSMSDGFPAERVWKLDAELFVTTVTAPAARTVRST